MRSHRWSVLLAVEAGIALCPAAVAGTGPHGHTSASAGPHRARAGTTSTAVTFRILPRPTGPGGNGPPSSTGPGGGPAAVAGSDEEASVGVDVDNGQAGSSWSGGRGSGRHKSGITGSNRHESGRRAHPGSPSITRTGNRAVRPAPRRGDLPFTGGDVGSAALTGVAALLAGAVALCLASVRGRGLTRGRRRAPRSG